MPPGGVAKLAKTEFVAHSRPRILRLKERTCQEGESAAFVWQTPVLKTHMVQSNSSENLAIIALMRAFQMRFQQDAGYPHLDARGRTLSTQGSM